MERGKLTRNIVNFRNSQDKADIIILILCSIGNEILRTAEKAESCSNNSDRAKAMIRSVCGICEQQMRNINH